MAVITSAASGNFSDTATWVGGVVPGVGDDAVAANGHVVAIDVDVTVLSVQQAGTGKFTLGNGRTLTGNVIANAGTFTSGGTVDVTATTTAVINGNVTGVSTTANNTAGVVVSGTGALTINGSVTGSAGAATNGGAVYTNVNCSITINGSVTGGTGGNKSGVLTDIGATSATLTIVTSGNVTAPFGSPGSAILARSSIFLNVTCNAIHTSGRGIPAINLTSGTPTVNITANRIETINPSVEGASCVASSASPTINVTATDILGGSVRPFNYAFQISGASATINIVSSNIRGGAASNTPAVYLSGANSTVNVTGSVFAVSTLSHGIRCDATTNGVIFQGDMTDSPQGAVAVYTRIFRMSATNSGVTRYANTVGYPSGTLVSRVSPDNVTGMASQADVRKPVVYGYNNELTGTMAVPSASSVAFGVPVDNTLGTAEFDLSRAATIIGLQVAAGKST